MHIYSLQEMTGMYHFDDDDDLHHVNGLRHL
jgi:hypothetical protein